MNKLEPLPEALQNSYDKDSLIYCNDDLMYYNVDFDKDLLYDITHKMYQIYNGTYRYNYEDTSTTIFLNGRGRNCGKKIFKIEGFYPYLYDYAEEGKYKTYLGDKVEKIVFFQEPRRVADYRRLKERSGERQPCEADILFCIKEGTKISLNNEFKNIEDCKVGDKILSCNEDTLNQGESKITNIKKKSVNSYLKISTQSGIIECDNYHKIPVLTKDADIIIKYAKDIATNDFLLSSKYIGKFGDGYTVKLANESTIFSKVSQKLDSNLIVKIQQKYGTCAYHIFRDLKPTRTSKLRKIFKDFNLDFEMLSEPINHPHQNIVKQPITDDDFFELFGYYIGDGNRISNDYDLNITDKSYENIKYYYRIFKKYINTNATPQKVKEEDSYKFATSSVILASVFRELGLDLLSHNRFIPNIIMSKCNKHQIISLLRGIFDAEGHAGENIVSLTSSSKNLIYQLEILLRRFGILSNICYSGGAYHLSIGETNSLIEFKKYIGFNDSIKLKRLGNINPSNNHMYYIYPFGDLLKEIKDGINLHKSKWKDYNFAIYDYTCKKHNQSNPSHNKIIHLIRGFREWMDYNHVSNNEINSKILKIENVLQSNLIPIKIRNIDIVNDNFTLYDLSLNKDYLFYANNVLVHNCRRFLIDTHSYFKPTEYVEPKICIVDLETNFPVNNNIISFAINGYDGFLYYNSINDTDKYRMILD